MVEEEDKGWNGGSGPEEVGETTGNDKAKENGFYKKPDICFHACSPDVQFLEYTSLHLHGLLMNTAQ
jgi:hypothetical protein